MLRWKSNSFLKRNERRFFYSRFRELRGLKNTIITIESVCTAAPEMSDTDLSGNSRGSAEPNVAAIFRSIHHRQTCNMTQSNEQTSHAKDAKKVIRPRDFKNLLRKLAYPSSRLAVFRGILTSSRQCSTIASDMIRTATIHDVPVMQAIINSHAELGRMLFKSYAELYENLRDFAVYELDGEVVGCTALAIIWADLAEVRSLAVDVNHQGRGIGRRLVEWCIDEARRLQIRRIMSLTYEQAFFEKLGFVTVTKESLPLKVWSDCVRCPKRDGCDEIAMVRELSDVPMAVMPTAPPTPRGVSIPVLPHEED
jgi:amino-acid N-acetyltransferase